MYLATEAVWHPTQEYLAAYLSYKNAEEEFVCEKQRNTVQVHLRYPVIDVVVIVCDDPELSEVAPGAHIAELVRSTRHPSPIQAMTLIVRPQE